MSEKLSNEDNKYLISLIKEEKIVEAVNSFQVNIFFIRS
mgnify:CR=1 FL=1